MRLGIASWTFILIALLAFLVVKESGARKLAITSEGDNNPLQLLPHDLQNHGTEGNIMQVEGSDVKQNNKPVKIDGGDDDDSDDESDDEDDDDDDHDHGHDDHKMKGKRIHKEEDGEEDKDEHKIKIKEKESKEKSSSHHMDHNNMDPELNVFFTPKDLQVGKTMPIYFGKKNSSTSPKFLPREEANKIPFSSKQLSSLIKFFSFSKHSPQAKAMKYTLKQCEIEPMEGETKFCATSLESLIDFARYLFGTNTQLKVLTTTHLTNYTVPLQNYTVSEVKHISVSNVIGCHPMPYPYAVFYCHSQHSDTNLYEVLVEGENGARVQAAAICHMDTTKWDRDHVSFSVLKIEPGSSPVCHFFPPDNLVWMPLPEAAAP